MGVAIAHRETIASPALTAAPYRFVEESLMGDTFDDTPVGRVIIDHMIGGVIFAEVVSHRGVGMTDGDVIELSVARDA